MVLPTTARAAAAAVCGAFLTGAGQLGVVYGLGILRWDRDFEGGQADLWSVQLTWVAWIAAISVVAGAVIGVDVALRTVRPADLTTRVAGPREQTGRVVGPRAQTRRVARPRGLGVRVVASLAAGIGAAVTVPLVRLPARFAHPPTPTSPGLTAGLIAVVALVPGVLAAVAVVSVAPVAVDVAATVAWTGLAALASVMWSVGRDDLVIAPRLGVLGHGQTIHAAVVYPAMLGIVVLITLAVAGAGRWAGRPRITVATCGAAGPVLVALAYLIGGPGSGDLQRVPYTAALLSVPVAVLVSVAVAFARRPVRPAAAADAAPGPVDSTSSEPTVEVAATHPADETPTQPVPASAPPAPTPAIAPKPPAPKPPTKTPPTPKSAAPKPSVPAARTAPDARPTATTEATQAATPADPQPDTTAAEPTTVVESNGTAEPPTARGAGRRGRGKRGGAKTGQPAQESEYVDWVRGLGTEEQRNPRRTVPGPRHASPTEEPPGRTEEPPSRTRRRGVLGLGDADE